MNCYHGICENCGKEYNNYSRAQIKEQCNGEYLFISCTRVVGENPFGSPKYCGGFVQMILDDSITDEDTSK